MKTVGKPYDKQLQSLVHPPRPPRKQVLRITIALALELRALCRFVQLRLPGLVVWGLGF